MAIELNAKQLYARDEVLRFAEDPLNAVFMVSGLAGTGKTTVLELAVEGLMDAGLRPAVCTPTGKAAHVINGKAKGKFLATTLHKVLSVRPIDNLATIHKRLDELSQKEMGEGLDDAERAEEQQLLTDLDSNKSNKLSFEPVPIEVFMAKYDILVFDEASMIGKTKTYDKLIERIPCPKIFFGDAAQLPPVQDTPALNLDQANVRLTEIMRQAADSGILPVAHHVQSKKDWLPLKEMAKFKDITIRKDFHPDMVDGFESTHQILCWKNATRHQVAKRVRTTQVEFHGSLHKFLPMEGEKVMVDENDDEKRLLKGQLLTIKVVTHYNTRANPFLCVVKCTDEFGKERTLTLSLTDLCEGYDMRDEASYGTAYRQDSLKRWADKEGVKVMWPYCLTVHKAQGSEWKKVVYLAEMPQSNKEWRKHAYTAITRASEEVVLCDYAFKFDRSLG